MVVGSKRGAMGTKEPKGRLQGAKPRTQGQIDAAPA